MITFHIEVRNIDPEKHQFEKGVLQDFQDFGENREDRLPRSAEMILPVYTNCFTSSSHNKQEVFDDQLDYEGDEAGSVAQNRDG